MNFQKFSSGELHNAQLVVIPFISLFFGLSYAVVGQLMKIIVKIQWKLRKSREMNEVTNNRTL